MVLYEINFCDDMIQDLNVLVHFYFYFSLWKDVFRLTCFFRSNFLVLMGYALAKDAYGRPPDLLTKYVTEF